MNILARFRKTPDEVKRRSIDYSEWLNTGETITGTSYEVDNVTVPPLVVVDMTNTDTAVTFFISGGAHNERYTLVIVTETSLGQVSHEAIVVNVKDYTP